MAFNNFTFMNYTKHIQVTKISTDSYFLHLSINLKCSRGRYLESNTLQSSPPLGAASLSFTSAHFSTSFYRTSHHVVMCISFCRSQLAGEGRNTAFCIQLYNSLEAWLAAILWRGDLSNKQTLVCSILL